MSSMRMIRNILIVLAVLNCTPIYSQELFRINAAITTNTKELGIKYSEAEKILGTLTPNYQYLFTTNSVTLKIYKTDGRLITLFIDGSGKMIAWHSQKLYPKKA